MPRQAYRATFLRRAFTGQWFPEARVLHAVNEWQARKMAEGIAAKNGWKLQGLGRSA